MKKTKFVILAVIGLILAASGAAYAGSPACIGAYYGEDGMLVAAKEIKGETTYTENKILLDLYKPENAAGAAVYKWDEETAGYEAAAYELGGHDISILCTADTHGSLVGEDGSVGIDRIAALKKMMPNAILLDSGDATQGDTYAAITRGEDVMITMNAAGYDGMTIGNHELDYGFETLRMNVSLAAFPVMSANMTFSETEDGREINVSANHIYEAGGYKVGVFGLTTVDTRTSTNADSLKNVTISDEIETAKAQVAYLKDEGADVIVALSHIGSDPAATVQSAEVAKALAGSGLDVIIDGHAHLIVNTGEYGIPIIEPGVGCECVGAVFIDVDADGAVSVDTELLSPAFFENIPSDEDTAEIIRAVVDEQTELLGEVISYSDTTLWGGDINGIREARVHEINFGDYLCDIMIEAAKKNLGKEYADVPVVAAENGGGIRGCIKPGAVTWRDVINVLPFSNTVEYKQINPNLLYGILEKALTSIQAQDIKTGFLDKKENVSGSSLQIGGMSFEYDPNAGEGKRIKNVYLDGSSKALDKNDKKTPIIFVSNDYVIGGSGGFDVLADIPRLGMCGGLAETLVSALKEYGENDPLSYPITKNRIRFAGGYKPADYEVKIRIKESAGDGFAENTDLTYYVDGEAKRGGTDSSGILNITVSDGPHSVSLDKKTEVYVNNYSGAGVMEVPGDYPIYYPVLEYIK